MMILNYLIPFMKYIQIIICLSWTESNTNSLFNQEKKTSSENDECHIFHEEKLEVQCNENDSI